jgi:hypothetical protein
MRRDFFITFAATATSLERNRTFQRERNSAGADLVRDRVAPSNRIGKCRHHTGREAVCRCFLAVERVVRTIAAGGTEAQAVMFLRCLRIAQGGAKAEANDY